MCVTFLHMHAHTLTIAILKSTFFREMMDGPPLEFTHNPTSLKSRQGMRGSNKFGRPKRSRFLFSHPRMVFCLTLLRSKVITDREIDASGTSTKHYMSRFQKGEMSEEDAQKMRDLLQKASLLSDLSFKGKPKQTNQWTWTARSSSSSSSSSSPPLLLLLLLYLLFLLLFHCIEICAFSHQFARRHRIDACTDYRVLESASEDAQAKAMKTLFIDFIKGVYSSFSTHMCLHLR